MAKDGEDIVLKSRANGSYKIIPITEDDTLMSKEVFLPKLTVQEKRQKRAKVKF